MIAHAEPRRCGGPSLYAGQLHRIHAWRAYGYGCKRAPLAGYYAVRGHTRYLQQGEQFPEELRR